MDGLGGDGEHSQIDMGGSDDLINRLNNRIAELEKELEKCCGPEFGTVLNGMKGQQFPTKFRLR